MDLVTRRTYKILGLSGIFFLSGLVFFLTRVGFFKTTPILGKPEKITLNAVSFGGEPQVQSENLSFNNLPPPEKFESFSIPYTTTELNIQGRCSDAYYTVLIYPAVEDYRKNPGAAKYNLASECPENKDFNHIVNLPQLNLGKGFYYIIKAQQGTQGKWYDPY